MRPAFHKGTNGKSPYESKEKKKNIVREERQPQMPLKNEAEVLMKM